jgi:hypothetical protein
MQEAMITWSGILDEVLAQHMVKLNRGWKSLLCAIARTC